MFLGSKVQPVREADNLIALCIQLCSFRYKYYFPTPHKAHNPNNYGAALMSAIPQAITPNPHTNLLNVYIQIANKMGLQ
jgi:hypothetical protein